MAGLIRMGHELTCNGCVFTSTSSCLLRISGTNGKLQSESRKRESSAQQTSDNSTCTPRRNTAAAPNKAVRKHAAPSNNAARHSLVERGLVPQHGQVHQRHLLVVLGQHREGLPGADDPPHHHGQVVLAVAHLLLHLNGQQRP
jgi:hypothetical protein